MFIPNRWCHIRRVTANTYDVYGKPVYSPLEAVKFALVRYDLKIDDSTVRADSSATRGNVKEFRDSGRVLFPVTVKPKVGDLLVIDGRVFTIKEVEPRYHVLGHLDHYECDMTKSEDLFGDE